MEMKRVGVLRGGPRPFNEASLASGQVILKNLPNGFEPVDIFVDTEGIWHIDGIPVGLPEVRERVDVIVNALHGSYGSDGQLQRQLELHHIPYTASGVTGSAQAYHRTLTKELLNEFGLRTPYGIVIRMDDTNWEESLATFFKEHPGPYMVKDSSGHGTAGEATTYAELRERVSQLRSYGRDVIVEEYIRGNESLVGVVENFRGEKHYTTIPSSGTSPEVEAVARRAHQTLGLKDYSVIHVINGPRGVFVLKAIAHPELHKDSHLPQALKSIGCSADEFVAHILR